jgi:hypothetical protein
MTWRPWSRTPRFEQPPRATDALWLCRACRVVSGRVLGRGAADWRQYPTRRSQLIAELTDHIRHQADNDGTQPAEQFAERRFHWRRRLMAGRQWRQPR